MFCSLFTKVAPFQLIFTLDLYFFRLIFGNLFSKKLIYTTYYSTFQVMMESIRAIIVCHRLGTIHLISFRHTVVRSYNSKTKSQTYRDVLSNFFLCFVFLFVERYLEGRSFFVQSYDCTMVRQKEIKWFRL